MRVCGRNLLCPLCATLYSFIVDLYGYCLCFLFVLCCSVTVRQHIRALTGDTEANTRKEELKSS